MDNDIYTSIEKEQDSSVCINCHRISRVHLTNSSPRRLFCGHCKTSWQPIVKPAHAFMQMFALKKDVMESQIKVMKKFGFVPVGNMESGYDEPNNQTFLTQGMRFDPTLDL